ncbi:MAG: hypothetical protein ACLFRD_08910, partial [Nitriliruptoraceae bacterium]
MQRGRSARRWATAIAAATTIAGATAIAGTTTIAGATAIGAGVAILRGRRAAGTARGATAATVDATLFALDLHHLDVEIDLLATAMGAARARAPAAGTATAGPATT